MGFDVNQAQEMQRRTEEAIRRGKSKSAPMPSETTSDPVELEIPLHRKILDWADDQWPPIPYLYANPTKRSRITLGAHDITLFLSATKTLCIEAKARDEKLKPDQRIWRKKMEMLGIIVHEIRNFEDFLKLV